MNLHIVTGASKGLGAALADFFAEKGDDVIGVSRTKCESHARIKHFPFDLASMDSKVDLIQKVFATYPIDRYRLITLTNNAGLIDPVMHIADLKEDAVVQNMVVNLTAPIALTAAFLKSTEKFKGLRIITNISSGVATHPIASWACYSAAKAGLKSFTMALAKDYESDEQVKMINFVPGIIDTEMQAHIREVKKDHFPDVDIFKNYKNENKLKTAKEVAAALGEYIIKNNFKNISEISIKNLVSS
jgi:benzil reductase ((S)-benzoin forming)